MLTNKQLYLHLLTRKRPTQISKFPTKCVKLCFSGCGTLLTFYDHGADSAPEESSRLANRQMKTRGPMRAMAGTVAVMRDRVSIRHGGQQARQRIQ